MTNCDCQENIEESTDDKETITLGDGLLIITVTSTAAVIFFGLRALCAGQKGALLTSMSLVSFSSCQQFFYLITKKNLYNKWLVLIEKKILKTPLRMD